MKFKDFIGKNVKILPSTIEGKVDDVDIGNGTMSLTTAGGKKVLARLTEIVLCEEL